MGGFSNLNRGLWASQKQKKLYVQYFSDADTCSQNTLKHS
jgi:hypothetical protein